MSESSAADTERRTPPERTAGLVRAAAVRSAVFAGLWWVLTEGALGGWPLAIGSIAAATLGSLRLVPPGPRRLSLPGLLAFLPFFAWQSVRGGVDVAGRALRPALPIEPEQIEFALRLPPGPARTFFAVVLSVLPGTVSTRLGEDAVRVHVLDRRLPIRATLGRLEQHVAALFGEELRDD